MTHEIARMAVGGDAIALTARELGHQHIGALLGIETPSAIYVGNLWGLHIYEGTVSTVLRRDETESTARVRPDQIVWVAAEFRTNEGEK